MNLASSIRRITGLLLRFTRTRRAPLAEPLEPTIQVPRHVAIIPDGNRRWARARGLPEAEGHRRGAQVVENLLWQCRDWGVSVLTFWGFSTENWERSETEVQFLMDLFTDLIKRNVADMQRNSVRFRHLGRRDRIPERLRAAIENAERRTREYSAYHFNLCLDYGGRDEIVRAVRRVVEDGLRPDEVTEQTLSERLDTAGLPDPDLIVRTSGELRLSGILPYQSVYSEFAFVDKHFPDMTADVLKEVFKDYSSRERRFGK
jgi:undecaprenyl diphosphate synthase